MCGIAGTFAPRGSHSGLNGVVDEIVASQYRRGPDNQAVKRIEGERVCAVLGHNRLSIIDLSAAGNQPMWDARGRFCVVYNGEIYNYIEIRAELSALGHQFGTRSDTEVLLEAFRRWGIGAVGRFNGMFAFGLFDRELERIYLVRDRFGIKPLYYAVSGQALVFASTGQVIARWMGLGPNLEYAARGIRFGVYDEGEQSPHVGLKALSPGQILQADISTGELLETRLHCYYNLTERVPERIEAIATASEPSLLQELAEVMASAVDIRFRSDVPVGVSLSGGLDSSSVAALSAAREHGEVIGFTFGHPDVQTSEGPLVAELAQAAGMRVHYLWPEPGDLERVLGATLRAQGAPYPSGSVMAQYLVYEAARAEGVKVLLGGQGGDEVFMGYRKFQWFRLAGLLRRGDYLQAARFATTLIPTAMAEFPRAAMYWRERHRYTSSRGLQSALDLPPAQPLPMGHGGEELWIRQAGDVTLTSLPTLLRYEDRNSMGNSVESRLPFMDYRLVELGLALPPGLKLRRGLGKWAIREVVRGRIPESIRTARYKRGFDVQQSRWIREGLGRFLRRELEERRAFVGPFLRTGARFDMVFSDEALISRPTAFAEAITLLWLADQWSGVPVE